MKLLSSNVIKTAIKKRSKLHRSQSVIARKVVAFQEIFDASHNRISAREVARLLAIPNSTMQSWQRQSEEIPSELGAFFLTPAGADFLQRNVVAVMKLMKCGPVGIRGMQEYLRNSGLDKFIASSEGALQSFWMRCEKCILEFGEREENKLAQSMQFKKITIGLDELFRSSRPCLVGIEIVSNYILLERFTEDRKAETWLKELKPRLQGANVEVEQIVSDMGSGICACAKKLKAVHIPEIFHAQYEVSKATSAALVSQEKGAKRAFEKAEEKVKKLSNKPLRIMKEAKKQQEMELEVAKNTSDILKKELHAKTERRQKVKESIKELSKIHHPIDLNTGLVQTADNMKKRFEQEFDSIQKCAQEAQLSESSIERIAKGRKAFDAILSYLNYFFIFYKIFVNSLGLCVKEEFFFNTVIFPLCYLKMIWRRLKRKERGLYQELLRKLEYEFQEALWPEESKKEWMKKGQELAEKFQRSSSCVEGRNGVLSLNHHRFHRLNERSLKVLTIVHNFDVRRVDGTTAAERFFGTKHENLFEFLVETVCIPGRPQRQYHDLEKRLQARKKCSELLLAA